MARMKIANFVPFVLSRLQCDLDQTLIIPGYYAKSICYKFCEDPSVLGSVRFVGGWGFNPHLLKMTPTLVTGNFCRVWRGWGKGEKGGEGSPTAFWTNRNLVLGILAK